MSSVEMLALGTAIGVAHSFEADHVAAVASLVDEENSGRAGLIGTSWGIGHAIPIAVAGLLFLAVGTRLPESVATVAELLAGLILVLLGARILWNAVETKQHTHDGHTHTHLSIGPIQLGSTHSHRGSESFLVGIVHGLAGSGVAIAGLATGASVVEGVSLLAAFAVASIATMGLVALLWGNVLSRTASRAVQAAAGVVAIVVGVLVLGNELFGIGLVGHDHGEDGHSHDSDGHGGDSHGGDGHDHGGGSHSHDGDSHEHAIDVLNGANDYAGDVALTAIDATAPALDHVSHVAVLL